MPTGLFFNKHGGLNFLLRCNYDVKYLRHIPTFYRDMLIAFVVIKTLYNYDQENDTILFNNRDILVDGKPLFIREWFIKGIHTIQQLFNENGQYLTFQEFQAKYHCNTNFLQFYQILSAIPERLRNRARVLGINSVFDYRENWESFLLSESCQSILKRIGQETIIVCFSLRNTSHLALAQKDGKEIFQQIKKTGKRFLKWLQKYAMKIRWKNFNSNLSIGLLLQRKNSSDTG